jgi:glycosyltransferase involved in cell wall biosynthesis
MKTNRFTLCVDARMINNSGIGVYIKYFVRKLLSAKQYEVVLLGDKVVLSTIFDQNLYRLVEVSFPIYSVKEQLKLPLLVPECDLFWSPHYNVPILPIKAKKHLVTIPDVYHLAFFQTLSIAQRVYAKLVLNAAVLKADSITTISHYSEKQIRDFISFNPRAISVIHLGLDTELFNRVDDSVIFQNISRKYDIPDKYILFVGNVKPNKNLKALVAAFKLLANKLSDYQVLIVGKRDGFINGDPELFRAISADPAIADRVVFTGYVELNDLPVIYSMATVFAFPSLYEGFGFPPLEAMACGTPVVASDRASIPEICGDAVVYADPDDTVKFAEALLDVCTNQRLRERLISKGLEHIKQYTWKRAGEKFLIVVNDLLTRKG